MTTQLERNLQCEILYRLARYPVSEQAAQFAHELHWVFGTLTTIAGRAEQLQVSYAVWPAPAQREDVINFVLFVQCLPAYRAPFVLRIIKSGYFGRPDFIWRSKNPPVVRPQAHRFAHFRSLAVFNTILFLLLAALWRCCLLLASLSYIRPRSPSFVIRAPFLTPLRLQSKKFAALGNVRPGFVLFPILCHILFSVFCLTLFSVIATLCFPSFVGFSVPFVSLQPTSGIIGIVFAGGFLLIQPVTDQTFRAVRIAALRPMYSKLGRRLALETDGTLLGLRDWIVVRHAPRITRCAA